MHAEFCAECDGSDSFICPYVADKSWHLRFGVVIMDGVILKDCACVLTQNRSRDVIEHCDIVIENGRIATIKKASTVRREHRHYEVMDCRKRIVMPSFVNAHTHSAMSLLRGYKDDEKLDAWLKAVWGIEKKMSGKDVYAGALFSCMEMIKSGTTCFVDMYFHMDEVSKAVEKIGMRAYLGYGMIDNGNETKRKNELKEAKKLIKTLEKNGNDKIKAVVAPHSMYTCSEELLVDAKKLANTHGLLLTMHLAETRGEVWYAFKKHALKPVEFLDKIGLLNSKTLFFHASWLTKGEIRLIGKRGCGVVHCPTSNMKLATGGTFPFREMRENGVMMALGTDGACSNNSLNMFQEMKNAALLQKWFRWNAKEIVAQDVLDMATTNPARILGLNTGSIEIGREADIIMLDVKHYSIMPSISILSNIVYSASPEAVSDVMVRGKFIMRNRTLVNIDEEKIKDKFNRRVEGLVL